MIDRNATRKILSGCSHSQPVLVPCMDCTERALQVWEGRIREDAKHALNDERRELESILTRTKDDLTKAQDVQASLRTLIVKLEKSNAELRDLVKAAKTEIAGMRAQLHAEQAVRVRPLIVCE